MYSPLVLLSFFGVLASQVLAFNITVGSKTFAAAELVDIPDSPVKTACAATCSRTTATLTDCNDDATCLCQVDTVASLLECETCMFHSLIATNKPAPDVRAGSNVILGLYATACKKEQQVLTAEQTLLQLPSNWDGPFVAILPDGGAAVAVAVAGFLGISALVILSNLE